MRRARSPLAVGEYAMNLRPLLLQRSVASPSYSRSRRLYGTWLMENSEILLPRSLRLLVSKFDIPMEVAFPLSLNVCMKSHS